MEPPTFSETCAYTFCNKLDFIPIRCDSCSNIYCSEHILYNDHGCVSSPQRQQTPLCPLCDLSYPRGMYGNFEIAAIIHVDQECESEIAVARRNWMIEHIRSCAW